MMFILITLIGFIAGWLSHLAADVLPRLAASHPAVQPANGSLRTPALYRVFRRADLHPDDYLPLLTELLSAALFLLLWWQHGPGWSTVALMIGVTFFLLVAVIDIRYRLVPNVLTYPAIAVIVLVQLVLNLQDARAVLVGGGLAFGLFFITATLKPGQLGGGDVKLAAVIGLAFGFPQVLWVLLLGTGIGALAAVGLLLTRRGGAATTMPYAPFLCLGAIALLVMQPLIAAI